MMLDASTEFRKQKLHSQLIVYACCDWPALCGKRRPPNFHFSRFLLLTSLGSTFCPWRDNFIPTLPLQGRMPKLASYLPSSRMALQPSTAAGRQFTSSLRRSLAHPRHGILKEPWLPPPPSPVPLPTTYFSPSRVRRDVEGLNGGPQNDHKPPDERVLKLGKSKNATPRHCLFTCCKGSI